MKSINEIIKDLNLIRLSGTRNFILLELNGSLCKLAYLKLTKPFYQLKDKEILNDIKIFSTKAFNWENSYEMISDELNSFIKTSGCNNPILLVGINEYKFTPVSLPAHIESEDGGEDIWFSENSSRFLPDGSYLDSFVFSYEKITEDENYKTFSVIVVRKDYLNNILRCLDSFKIGGIFPFIITITALKSFTTNVLLIDFSINKVTYSFYDTRGKLFVSELFTNIYNNQHNLENRKLNTEELANSLIEIKNFLHSSFPGQLSEKLSFFICCQKKDLPEIEKCVWEIFSE